MATATELIEEIKKMSVLELSELIKALEEEFGVSATAVAAAAPAGGGGGGEAAQVRDAAAGQQRADGVALAGLLEVGEDVGQQPGGRLEHLGAQRAHGAEQLAVLDDLGLAAQAALDVAPLGAAELRDAVGGAGQHVRQVSTSHG